MPDRDDQKRQIQEATDLVRLIGEHVRLHPKGKEFAGLCPFHDDNNPSMFVSPVKQIYKCFVCGAGGDVFSFAMNYHKMTFPEAMQYLADRAGIKLVSHRRGADEPESPAARERRQIADANGKALAFFQHMLGHERQGEIARDYLESRGFTPEMIEQFQIGYAPDGWSGLTDTVRNKSWNLAGFELAGLVSKRQQAEGHYDRMRHRLIFPICDAIGRPIAFGGRKLRDEDEPKYLNSPETALFNKSGTLYGLHLAKQAILGARTAVIVEGYTDVTACHQAGLRNVVATLGTALTGEHVKALRYFADRVVLIFDADEAGQRAADRAIEVFFGSELDVAMAVLPDRQDPAELLARPDGKALWEQAVGDADDALTYQFKRMKHEFDATDSVTGRQRVAESYLQRIANLGVHQLSPIRRSLVVQRLAEMLHLTETLVGQMLRNLAPVKSSRPSRSDESSQPRQQVEPSEVVTADPGSENSSDFLLANPENAPKIKAIAVAERNLIGCLLREPGLFHQSVADGRTIDEAVTPAEFMTQSGRSLYEFVYDHLAEGQHITLSGVLAELAETGRVDLAQIVTQAEMELDAALRGREEQLTQVLHDAANTLLNQQREQEYHQAREALLNRQADKDTDTPTDEQLLLKQMLEHRRASPSPVRIARPGLSS